MNRAERRAAMRLNTTAEKSVPTSAAQIAANRANAQLSTGPRSEATLAISSFNALKTGLTGRTVLLPSDDIAEYQTYVSAHQDQFKPVGVIECDLAQAIADSTWRLRRISSLEHALFAKGRLEFADQFKGADPALVDLHTIQTYEKQFRNLHIQETRLASRREKDIKELRAIQKERLQKQEDLLANCAAMYRYAKTNNIAWEPAESGFEFSIPEIEHFLAMQNSKIGEMSLGKAA